MSILLFFHEVKKENGKRMNRKDVRIEQKKKIFARLVKPISIIRHINTSKKQNMATNNILARFSLNHAFDFVYLFIYQK